MITKTLSSEDYCLKLQCASSGMPHATY